jgi:DNA-directed RNA polymerase subunit RPC12/RpoP
METEYSYVCPNCSKECSVPESLTGQNLVCPNCSHEFFATPPEPQSHFSLPGKLPFFKSGRRKILEQKFTELIADGELDKNGENELDDLVTVLGLDQVEVSKIQKEKFAEEFEPIKKRMETSFILTDEDLETIKRLERKYDTHVTLAGYAEMYRSIYLVESKGQLPTPISTNLLLKSNEVVYYSISTTWHQTRVRNRGYSGTSISIPSGIRGVRFRFGGYTPIRSEEMAPLSGGILYVTSQRLLFNGDARNTTINLNKIVDGHVFSDSVRIEKNTGKPDLFSMNPPEARYILALIGALK